MVKYLGKKSASSVLKVVLDLDVYKRQGAPFLFFHENPAQPGARPVVYTRGDFLILALKAADVLKRLGIERGVRFLNAFGANSPMDLAFRLGAALAGATPVTLNWQADTAKRAGFKASLSMASLIPVSYTHLPRRQWT